METAVKYRPQPAWIMLGIFPIVVVGAIHAGDAQPIDLTPRLYDKVIMKNGATHEGQIIRQDNDSVIIQTNQKTRATFPRKDVAAIVPRAETPEKIYREYSMQIGKGDEIARLALANACEERGLLKEAVEELIKAVQEGGKRAELLVKHGLLLLKLDRIEEARDAVDRAQNMYPDRPDVQALRAAVAARQASPFDIVADVSRQVANDPANVPLRITLAKLLIRVGRPREAVAHFEQVIEKAPGNLTAWIGLGEARMAGAEYVEAAVAFQKAKSMDPKDESALAGLAGSQLFQGKYLEARQTIQGILLYRTQSAKAYSLLAMLDFLEKADPLDKAREQLGKAERFGQTNARLLLFRAYLEELDPLGGLDRALTLYQQAAAKDPFDLVARYLFGYAALRSDQLGQAESAYREVAKRMPEFLDAALALGGTLLYENKAGEAERIYEETLKRHPESAEAAAGVALALLHREALEPDTIKRAEELLAKALAADPKNTAALLGKAYLTNLTAKQPDQALRAAEYLRLALANDPRNEWALDSLNKIYQNDRIPKEVSFFGFASQDVVGKFAEGRRNKPLRLAVSWEPGLLVVGGTQVGEGTAEAYLDVGANKVLDRWDADVSLDAGGSYAGGLLISNRNGYLHFGKTESGKLGYRFKDQNGPSDWNVVGEWPAKGRVSLAITTTRPTNAPQPGTGSAGKGEPGSFRLTMEGTEVAQVRVAPLTPDSGLQAGLFVGGPKWNNRSN